MQTCMICGFEDPDEVVIHINTNHAGGLSTYHLYFDSAVVSETVYRNVENAVLGLGPVDHALIADITDDDRELIVSHYRRVRGPSSEILVTEDF